ncbi:MAG: hypothetical protein HKN44_08605 [Ilumatobacter sp.]|nr:hypothetical protein [Ilumatobacter sp.]
MVRRIFALLACAVALAACQVDVTVDVVVEPDGTGLITVAVVADADVVRQVPTLAEELVLDDVIEAGWSIDGPNPTDDGGLQIVMSHPFRSQGEATNLLQSLGPPFTSMELGRGTNGDVTTNRLSGRLVLVDGFESFADDELVAAVGALPFASQIEASGATPETSMSVRVRALLPGVLNEEATNVEPNAGGVLEWDVPLDGSVLQWQAETTQQPGEGERWARPVSIAALVALIAWVAFMTLFIGYVAFARFRRARRYRQRNLPA